MGLFKKKSDPNKNGFINIEIKHLFDWDEPTSGNPDSGWRFFKVDEDEEYSNNSNNHHVFSLNTICNYDIIPYLHSPVGTYLIRTEDGTFIEDDGTKEICMVKQEH